MTMIPRGYDAICRGCKSPFTYENARSVEATDPAHYCSTSCAVAHAELLAENAGHEPVACVTMKKRSGGPRKLTFNAPHDSPLWNLSPGERRALFIAAGVGGPDAA